MTGRVTVGAAAPRPAAHSPPRVTPADGDRAWLCDVGFGAVPAVGRPVRTRAVRAASTSPAALDAPVRAIGGQQAGGPQ